MFPIEANADITIGGGGGGEHAVRYGIWDFDLLSEAQQELPSDCSGGMPDLVGDLISSQGWYPASYSTIIPRIEALNTHVFTPHDSAGIRGYVLTFYDNHIMGFSPYQMSVMEGPVIDLDSLGAYHGQMLLSFYAFSDSVPDVIKFAVLSRVYSGEQWTQWSKAEVPIQTGTHLYRVRLNHGYTEGVELVQAGLGVENVINEQVRKPGPVVDKVKLEVKDGKDEQGQTAWKYVPDISQGDTDYCMAAAFANCISYLATHGFPELDPKEKTRKEKNEEIQRELIQKIYTEDKGNWGASSYLRDKGAHYKQKKPGETGLRHVSKSINDINWDMLFANIQACHDVVISVRWYGKDGKVIDKDGHSMTVGGITIDSDGNKKIHVANPWDPSTHAVDESNAKKVYNTLDATIEANGKIKLKDGYITKNAEGIGKKGEYMLLEHLDIIFPDTAPEKLFQEMLVCNPTRSETSGMTSYEYSVYNTESTPVNFFALQVLVPYGNVQSPPGWMWYALPVSYPESIGCYYELKPSGIAWMTSTDPIPPGTQLAGFGFDADEGFRYDEEGLNSYIVVVSNSGLYDIAGGPVPGCVMDGDPGIYIGFDEDIQYVRAGEDTCWTIGPANFGFVSSGCTEMDTFCMHAYDSKGWIVIGDPPLDRCATLEPGQYFYQNVCVTVPCSANIGDIDTLIVTMAFCDNYASCAMECGDCENPNWFMGKEYYSTDTLVLHVIGTAPYVEILQDSICFIELGQTAAYVPFALCNGNMCSPPEQIGYMVMNMGHLPGNPSFPQAGSAMVDGGDCGNVYAVINAGSAAICEIDTLTIIAWIGTSYDTCVQIIHVVEPVEVPLFTAPVVTILALVMILAAAVIMRRKAAGRV